MELGSGGGVINYGDLTVTNSTITGNIATHTAGAIYNARGTLTLIDSTLSGNSANFGGSIYNSVSGILSLISTTVSGNTADSDGGGIYNSFGPVTLTNSTVSGNTATGDGGGIYNKDRLTVTNSTVTRNMVETGIGGGIFIDNISNPALAITELGSSIIAENTASADLGPDCYGFVTTSLGYNLFGSNVGCGFPATTGDLVGDFNNPIDPLLGPLQDNGGPTLTNALAGGSLAIDQIPVGDCVVATDQRGVSRPQGATCDIGAFELGP